MKKIILIILIIISIGMVRAIPNDITVHGWGLREGTLLNGNYNVTMRIYYVFSGGSVQLTENYTDYSIYQGQTDIIVHNVDTLNASEDWYIEVDINGSTITPRFNVTSTVQALIVDEIEWTSILNRPAGLDDGDDDNFNTSVDMINAVNETGLNASAFTDMLCSQIIFDNGKGSAGICDGSDGTGSDSTCDSDTCDVTNTGTLDGYEASVFFDNTNASTACTGTEYLAGDGVCYNVSVSDTDTFNSTIDMINAVNRSAINIDCAYINFSGTLGAGAICDGTDADTGGQGNTTADMRNAINNTGDYNINLSGHTVNGDIIVSGEQTITADSNAKGLYINMGTTTEEGLHVYTDDDQSANNPLARFHCDNAGYDQSCVYIISDARTDATAGILHVSTGHSTHDEEVISVTNAGTGEGIYIWNSHALSNTGLHIEQDGIGKSIVVDSDLSTSGISLYIDSASTINPAIQLDTQAITSTCNSTYEGSFFYNGSGNKFTGCDGTDWVDLTSQDDGTYMLNSTFSSDQLDAITNAISPSFNNTFATLNDLTSGNITITSLVNIKNTDSVTLSAGDPVYYTSYNVGISRLDVLRSNNSAMDTHADCLVLDTVASNGNGQCVVFGEVIGADTSVWSDEDDLYLDVLGNLTNIKPINANCIQKVGMVLRSHANLGVIYVFGAGRCNDVGSSINVTGNIQGATVDTGQGANELYDMNQNVLTTSTPVFDSIGLTDWGNASTFINASCDARDTDTTYSALSEFSNDLSFFNDISNFTATLTQDKWCAYDGTDINCTIEPVVDTDTDTNTWYDTNVTSFSITGTTTKTLTIEQDDQTNITAIFTDIDTDTVNTTADMTNAVNNTGINIDYGTHNITTNGTCVVINGATTVLRIC